MMNETCGQKYKLLENTREGVNMIITKTIRKKKNRQILEITKEMQRRSLYRRRQENSFTDERDTILTFKMNKKCNFYAPDFTP